MGNISFSFNYTWIFWEQKILIVAVLQVEFLPILGVYMAWAAQQSVVAIVWFSSSIGDRSGQI